MVGGSDDDFATAKPVLDLLGQNIWHCGPPGTGHAMKTVLNLSNQAKMFIEIEALLVGRAAGLDAQQMAEVLGLGAWRAFLMGPDGRRRFGFSLGMSCKDYDVGLGVATEEQVPVPAITAVTEAMRVILDEIGPDADIIDYVTVLERNARRAAQPPGGARSMSDASQQAGAAAAATPIQAVAPYLVELSTKGALR